MFYVALGAACSLSLLFDTLQPAGNASLVLLGNWIVAFIDKGCLECLPAAFFLCNPTPGTTPLSLT